MLRSLNIRQRLIAVNVLFAVLILALGSFGIYAAQQTNAALQRYTYHVVEAAGHAGELRAEMLNLRRYEKDIVINVSDAAKVKDYVQQWEAAYQRAQKRFDEIEKRLANPEVAKNLAKARASLKAYHDNIEKEIPQLDGKDVAAANTAMRAGREGFVEADKIVGGALELVAGLTATVQKKFAASYTQVLTVTVVLISVALVLMVALGIAVSRSIVKPLRSAQDFAGQVRDGDLTGELQASGRDEAAELSRSLAEMQGSLQTIVGNVRAAADSIQVASSEVASGNHDLSHRTEQTAASLQQTASAMNQITATVNQTADAARTAAQLASQASSSAERGGAVVGEVVSTMERINQGSRRIADIIGTIDGIAFQTNILALNAAVEAARAGEQGRGFAVVAGEVRLLAGRSAEAAKEIKSLINASVESVDVGSRLVADAGSTMSEIVANVQRVTDIIGEISAATGEQSSGIGNVNESVAQLDQATQQNAALVEESAAAAQSLREQALKLAEVVSSFRLPGMAGSARSAPAPKPAAKAAAPTPAAARSAPKAPAAAKAPAPAAPAPAPRATPPAPAPAADAGDWETF